MAIQFRSIDEDPLVDQWDPRECTIELTYDSKFAIVDRSTQTTIAIADAKWEAQEFLTSCFEDKQDEV